MSDLLSELPRPPQVPTWRGRLTEWAESLDLTPGRLVLGTVALVAVALVGWKLLAPPAPPPEMRLPFVSTTAAPDATGSATPEPSGSAGAAPNEAPGEEAATEVVVHVVGAVATPGVRRLPAGARVVDAVDAAGGAVADADLSRLNLAAPVEDGQQVYVPRVGEVVLPPVGPAGGASGAAGTPGDADDGGPVNLNTATVDELDALPGVGPTIAQAIVDHRSEHGPFESVDQLIEVSGIGEAKLEQLRSLVVV